MISEVEVDHYRKPDHSILEAIWKRWSPRIMSGEPVDQEQLLQLFEAARWAPSCYNRQPWRFVYATKESSAWNDFFDLLVEGNQRWCEQAGALIVVVAKTVDEQGKPNPTYAFDVGSAWQNLALQGCELGLVIHGMAGFDYEEAAALVGFPENHEVLAMVAVGHPGKLDSVPAKNRDRELPSGRDPVEAFAFEGNYRAR